MFGFLSVHGQKSCDFEMMSDSVICSPATVKLWFNASQEGKTKWFGEGILSNDTLPSIQAQIDSTTIFYATNRIVEGKNLITNGDFEQGNTNFTSDYLSSCLNGSMPQGTYCINSSTDSYWPSWKSCSDHTKTGVDNMYVTDGAILPNEKIWCQTVTVDPFEDYALSAWLTPVLNLNNAELQFTINNQNIGEIFKAKETECEWNEFFEIWNSDINTSAEICITNQNTASNGNDFALDDIAFNKVCYAIDSVKITVMEEVEFSLPEDTIVCPGDEFTIQPNKIFPTTDYNYTWNTGANTSQITVDDIGRYKLTVTHNSGCTSSDSMDVSELKSPDSYLPNDTTVCLSISNGLLLNPGVSKWTVWKYEGIKDTAQIKNIQAPGFYEVTLYNGTNCFTSDRITVEDFCSTALFIPNAFTPNNDGLNDTFGPESVETYSLEMRIFNRMGKVIFQTTDLNTRWDGNNAPQGTYAYWIKYELASKETGQLQSYTQTGVINLIR